jgi:CheY-like chemotaxis protein
MNGLEGKKVAIIGLSREDLFETTGALERAGAAWQAFNIADAASLERSDLVIAGAASARLFAELEMPMLVIGGIDDATEHDGDQSHLRNFVLAPPLKGEEVAVRASQLLRRSAGSPRRASSTPVVVAADDDPTTTAIVRMVLTQNGMTCHTAPDGRQALELIRKVDPALVVLDVNMPFIDGFEVLSAIRNDPGHADLSVVMLTSVQQESDVVRAFSLGADDYVVKPFNPMELLARIKRLVKKQP